MIVFPSAIAAYIRPRYTGLLFLCFMSWLPIANAQTQPSSQQQRNMTAFCRLFGYIRYFHPSDEAQQINWELFAVYGSQRVLSAANDSALIAVLKELYMPLAPTLKIFRTAENVRFEVASVTPPDLTGFKEISWQYSGMSMRYSGGPRPDNPTVRLNRPSPDATDNTPDSTITAMAVQYIPVKYQGYRFSLKGQFKIAAGEQDSAQLWLTSFGNDKQGPLYQLPIKGNNWKEYTLEGTIDSNSQQLIAGISFKRKGTLRAKQLRLFAHKDGQQFEIPLKNSDFRHTDKDGLVQDWLLAPREYYRFTKTTDNGTPALEITSLKERTIRPLYAYKTSVGEYRKKELVPGISAIVPLALYGTNDYTYPKGNAAAVKVLSDSSIHLAMRGYRTADSLELRMGTIAVAWNIYRHFFPFWPEAGATSDQLLQLALTKAFKDKTPHDFFLTLKLMSAPMNDGHIFVSYIGDSSNAVSIPLVFTKAEDKIVIREVLDSVLLQQIKTGDIVDSIDGQTAQVALNNLKQYISGAPQLKEFKGLIQLANGFPGTKMTLALSRGDHHYNVVCRRTIEGVGYRPGISEIHPRPSGEIAKGVYYVNLKDSRENIAAVIATLENAKQIIFDVRFYPSYDLFEEVLSHLNGKSLKDPNILHDIQVVYPDYEKVKYTSSSDLYHPVPPLLKGRIYCLSDASIGSHPEYFMQFIKQYKLATIVGEATAGFNGTINGFSLPGGYDMSYTGVLVTDPNGNGSHLDGVIPDVVVHPTIAGIRDGRDEILEKALQLATEDAR